MLNPFTPGVTVALSATVATARVALPLGKQMRIRNFGADNLFVRFGDSAVNAAVTDMPIGVNESVILTPPVGATHIAGICGTSTALAYITGGSGQ